MRRNIGAIIRLKSNNTKIYYLYVKTINENVFLEKSIVSSFLNGDEPKWEGKKINILDKEEASDFEWPVNVIWEAELDKQGKLKLIEGAKIEVTSKDFSGLLGWLVEDKPKNEVWGWTQYIDWLLRYKVLNI